MSRDAVYGRRTAANGTAAAVVAASAGSKNGRHEIASRPFIPLVLPEFPTNALPGPVAAFVEAVAKQSATPADLAAMGVLGVLSAVAMGSAVVNCGEYKEELCFYALMVMPSGDRKSTVMSKVTRPLIELQRNRQEQAAPDVRAKRTDRDVLQIQRAKLIKQAAQADKPEDRNVLTEELRILDEKIAEIGDPQMPQLLADDATPEALAGLLAHNPKIAVIAAETAIVDNLLGNYTKDGSPNLHLACQAYEGEPAFVHRRGRDPEEIPRPLLSIVLNGQPHVQEKLLASKVAVSQGLVARFWFVSPESLQGERPYKSGVIPQSVIDGWASVVRLVADRVEDPDADRGSPAEILLSPAADGLLERHFDSIEPRLAKGGDLCPVAPWVNRYIARVARLAALLHLVEHPAHEPISGETMANALRIGGCLFTHGLSALLDSNPLVSKALKHFAEKDETYPYVSRHELHVRVLNGKGNASGADELAAELVALGYLVPYPQTPPGQAPQSGPWYEILPELMSTR